MFIFPCWDLHEVTLVDSKGVGVGVVSSLQSELELSTGDWGQVDL